MEYKIKIRNKKNKIGESIKKWPKSERPRELLLEKGPDFISDAGLVAILLHTGIKGKDVVSLGRELIGQFGGLSGLLNARRKDLEKIKGLGSAKIAQLMAATEIVKRQLKENIIEEKYIENEKDVMDYLSLSMKDLKEEFFKVMYLNKANVILSIDNLAKGTVGQASIYPREVIKKALDIGASGIIFIHNHPSGSLNPSQLDIDITKKLVSACNSVDITPLDHIIISSHGHLSLKNKELLQ